MELTTTFFINNSSEDFLPGRAAILKFLLNYTDFCLGPLHTVFSLLGTFYHLSALLLPILPMRPQYISYFPMRAEGSALTLDITFCGKPSLTTILPNLTIPQFSSQLWSL